MKTILFEDYDTLRDVLYSHHLAGGPLHIVTDDNNVADEHLDFCQKRIHDGDDPKWLRHVMFAIIEYLRQIPTEEERGWFVLGMNVEVDDE